MPAQTLRAAGQADGGGATAAPPYPVPARAAAELPLSRAPRRDEDRRCSCEPPRPEGAAQCRQYFPRVKPGIESGGSQLVGNALAFDQTFRDESAEPVRLAVQCRIARSLAGPADALCRAPQCRLDIAHLRFAAGRIPWRPP